MLSIEQKNKLDKVVYYSKIVVSVVVGAYVGLMLSVSLDGFFHPYGQVSYLLYSVVSGIVLVYAFYHTSLYISPNRGKTFLKFLFVITLAYSLLLVSLLITRGTTINLDLIVEAFAYIVPIVATSSYLYKKPPFSDKA